MNMTAIYQEIIMDHYKHPRHREKLDYIDNANVHENPACGDSLKLDILLDKEGKIEKVLFDGTGCAISMASASMMTEFLEGKRPEEAKEQIEGFLKIMRGEKKLEELEGFGELMSLKGIVRLPIRVKCATLAWHAAIELLISRR